MLKQEIILLGGVEGKFARKSDVEEYIKRVKQKNPQGVVLCIDTEEGTHERVKTDGAFNVYLHLYEKVYIDFLGKGFDMSAITKGQEIHESWAIDWNKLLFLKPNNMNQERTYLTTQENYLDSAKRRLVHLLNIGYKEEELKEKIPRKYTQMPLSIKEMLLNEIIFPLYCQKNKLRASGLNSFGVQGMIIGGKLFPIEFNREERFATRGFYDDKGEER